MNWQPYFDGETIDLGYKMFETGRPSMLFGGLPYHICANMDKTAAGLQECKVDILINEDTELIEEASCTCESFVKFNAPCRHMAATMFAWEKMKDSDRWYSFFHGYKTCDEKDLTGIKYDIDQDFAEYEKETGRQLDCGIDKQTINIYYLNNLWYEYAWFEPFGNLMKSGNYVQLFEIYRYIAEKVTNFKFFDKAQRKSFYHSCASSWERIFFYSSKMEKLELKSRIDEFLALDKKDYRYICARLFRKKRDERFESSDYILYQQVAEFFKTIPQGYVVTCSSVIDGLKLSNLTFREVSAAVNYPDPESDIKTYKLVKADGGMSKYLSGLENDLQKSRLEEEGTDFIGKKVNLESCLY